MVTRDIHLRQMSEAMILDRLRERGYRMTSSRNCIVRAVIGQGDAFTAQMLIETVTKNHDGIGRSTVFRTLDLLVSEGMLDQIHLADGSLRYTLAPNALVHHHHLICTSCEKTLPFTGCTVETMIDGLEQETGFVISGHQLEFFGVCDDCQPEMEISDSSAG